METTKDPPMVQNPANYFQDTVRAGGSNISNFFRGMLEEQRREEAIEKGVQLAARQALEISKQTTEESKLAMELVDNKRRNFIEQKRRQQLRENNEELRQLEMKLRAAYTGKALAAQIAEREAIRQQEKLLCEQENNLLEAARIKDAEYRQMQLEEERKRKKHFREEMIEQIAERATERAKKYEEFLKEKKILDEISRKLIEEEMAELKEKAERQTQFRKDIQDFLCMQKSWREQHKQITDDEDVKLAEFLKKREAELAAREREKQEMKLKRQEISDRIGNEVAALYNAKMKRQELIENLLVAEYSQRVDEEQRKKLEKQLRERIQVRLQLAEQKADNLRRKFCQQEEDRIFREEQMQLLAERDKLELLSNEKRRRKILEHRKEIQNCLDEKKKRRAEEVALLVKQRDDDFAEENRMRQLIEEERILMLKEHATELMGFLPPGILRESDREFLPLPPIT
ncbi:unnamed protein product [Hermetia illucens]|uniref:Meiosis-specific nuclear structural protein 1 n=2 Tax=Hermetia illucens TaxID=343691 RepID=A0A7R8UP99_HERIL|nr:meiosis-specific nuclear structural protein 1 isoform X3 [Hermetia illucens]XP_037909672.1 meiosis-specific nuclear structural protein 1 isoform X3 [Hermetia illucens]CAD7084507.1 unnamed protein product [Hermetia illucens]